MAGFAAVIVYLLANVILGIIAGKLCATGKTTIYEIIDDDEMMEDISTCTASENTKIILAGMVITIVAWPYAIFVHAEDIAGTFRRILSVIKES